MLPKNIILPNFSSVIKTVKNNALIAVYKHPKDFPDSFVARLFISRYPTRYCVVRKTYDELFSIKPKGMCVVPRDDDDDPVIVESWL